MPDGKVKIRLESDGSLLDVDEDDVEKVFNHQINSGVSSITDEADVCMCVCTPVCVFTVVCLSDLPDFATPGKPTRLRPRGRPGLVALSQ